MSLDTLKDLFLDEIKDLYSAEKQLLKALPKMAKAATDEELAAGFTQHLEETRGQVTRLEQVFASIDEKPKAKHCNAMEGLIEEGQEIIDEDGEDNVKDAALIAAAQKVEHYEIASYGSARAHAKLLGFDEAADLLEETLNEEKATDDKLNDLAETKINSAAESEGDDTDEGESKEESDEESAEDSEDEPPTAPRGATKKKATKKARKSK